MSANVEITITNVPSLNQVLIDSEIRMLMKHGRNMVLEAQSMWTGWKYGKNYPSWQRGESHAAWQYKLLYMTTSGRERGISLQNKAKVQRPTEPTKAGKPRSTKSVGKFYARYVTRSGSTEPEYKDVVRRINSEIMPTFLKDLKKEILSSMGESRETVKLRNPKPGAIGAKLDIFSGELA